MKKILNKIIHINKRIENLPNKKILKLIKREKALKFNFFSSLIDNYC